MEHKSNFGAHKVVFAKLLTCYKIMVSINEDYIVWIRQSVVHKTIKIMLLTENNLLTDELYYVRSNSKRYIALLLNRVESVRAAKFKMIYSGRHLFL